MRKVDRDFVDKKNPPKISYRHVRFDEDGWADASKWLPADYDLVFLKLERGPTIAGWAYGNEFLGLKLKDDDKVLYWKRKPDEKYI